MILHPGSLVGKRILRRGQGICGLSVLTEEEGTALRQCSPPMARPCSFPPPPPPPPAKLLSLLLGKHRDFRDPHLGTSL